MKIEIDNEATLKSKIRFASTCVKNAYKWPQYKLHWLGMALNQLDQAQPFLLEELDNCDKVAAEALTKANRNKALKPSRLVG